MIYINYKFENVLFSSFDLIAKLKVLQFPSKLQPGVLINIVKHDCTNLIMYLFKV